MCLVESELLVYGYEKVLNSELVRDFENILSTGAYISLVLFTVPFKRVLPRRVSEDFTIFASNTRFDYTIKGSIIIFKKLYNYL